MELTHTASREGRLSSFLRQELGLSAGLMNRLKWQNKLFVNGIARHADYPVAIGDVITIPLEEDAPDYPAEHDPIQILYEDDCLLAVEKPAGMLIHPSRSRYTGTLANRVAGYYQRTGQCCVFHPITRLDRDTFGVVLLAKNAHIHSLLTQQQEAGAIQKTYHALVWGVPAESRGTIDAPIARLPLPSLLRCVHPQGKPSVTRYQVAEAAEMCSKLILQPITGRTHQLRVHCAYIGHPILGDPQYGTPLSRQLSEMLGLESQLLCAKTLELPHPVTGSLLHLESQQEILLKPY